MPLTIPKIKNAVAKEKDYKLSDEKGLFLLVKKTAVSIGVANIALAGKKNY